MPRHSLPEGHGSPQQAQAAAQTVLPVLRTEPAMQTKLFRNLSPLPSAGGEGLVLLNDHITFRAWPNALLHSMVLLGSSRYCSESCVP